MDLWVCFESVDRLILITVVYNIKSTLTINWFRFAHSSVPKAIS